MYILVFPNAYNFVNVLVSVDYKIEMELAISEVTWNCIKIEYVIDQHFIITNTKLGSVKHWPFLWVFTKQRHEERVSMQKCWELVGERLLDLQCVMDELWVSLYFLVLCLFTSWILCSPSTLPSRVSLYFGFVMWSSRHSVLLLLL